MSCTPDATAAVRVDRLTCSFGPVPALRGVSFEVRPGEVFGLVGPNGAGKSTTIHILLTLVRPTSGLAEVAGVDVTARPDAVRRAVGWVPQERAVDPLLTARENLRFAAGLHHLDRRTTRRRAGQLLDLVDLARDADRLVRDFSGGMRRRLELGMGLIHRPAVLFLDEPTLGLDIAGRRRLWAHVDRVRSDGTTILLTTHYLDEADSLCDRVAIIDRGRIQAIGTPEQLKRANGHDTLHLELATPSPALLERLCGTPELELAGADRGHLWFRASNLALAAGAVLGACREAGVVPRDLWTRRASLDDVFLGLTGRELSSADTGREQDERDERVVA